MLSRRFYSKFRKWKNEMILVFLLVCGVLMGTSILFPRSHQIIVRTYSEFISGIFSSPFDACILPDYDPWDESIIPYIDLEYNPLKNCNHNFKHMTTLRNGTLIKNEENVTCWGRCLTRQGDGSNERGEWMNVDETNFRCDVVEAKCKDGEDKDIYQMVHAQIIEKNYSTGHNDDGKDRSLYNVYVILLDSHSSTQGTRNLPQSLHFFEKSMEAVSFPYINKVGLNSWPNGIAMWFGKSASEVNRKLFGVPDVKPDWTYASLCPRYADNETFIFKEFSAYGYKTMLAEDWMFGVLNWPDCKGFKNQPTDHYMRPFQIALQNEADVLLTRTYNMSNCIEQHHDILRYMQDFINSYEDIPKFGWIWLSLLGHDHGSGTVHADPDFQRFLLRNKKKLDDSFLIIMGDHGLRGNKITRTKMGDFEMNNLMFSISIPKSLRRKTAILSTLRENAKHLHTPYEIRATLLDILKYQPGSNFKNQKYMPFEGEYGASLLRKQSGAERTCKSLLIPLDYCICQYPLKEIEGTGEIAVAAGSFLIDYLNAMIAERNATKICEKLKFKQTISISAYVPEDIIRTYRIIVKEQPPGDGEYKAIVRRVGKDFELISQIIDRIDRFGNAGNCAGVELRHFCRCK